MSLLFVEGFDHYAIADATKKWDAGGVSGSSIVAGRVDGSAWSVGTTTMYLQKIFSASNETEMIVGFAIKSTSYTTFSGLATFYTVAGVAQLSLSCNSTTGILSVRRGDYSAATIVDTGRALTANNWNYIEMRVLFSQTVGEVEIRVNGEVWANSTGLDTCADTNVGAGILRLGNGTAALNSAIYDDLYIIKKDGSGSTDFLGDVRVKTLFPTANGTTTQLTPSAGTNYENVDDATAETTNYNSSTVAGNKDLYTTGDLTVTGGTVYGLQVVSWAAKDNTGTRSVSNVVKSSTTTDVKTAQAVSTSYDFYSDLLALNPDGSVAWTESTVNAAEIGVQVA